jgi:hypothetical protein
MRIRLVSAWLAAAALAAMAFAAQSRAAACDVSWASAVSGNWTDATKWSTGIVPTSTQNVCITVSGTYTVKLTGPVTVASLTLGGGSNGQTLAVSTSHALGATLSLNGSSSNSGTLELTDSDPATSGAAVAEVLIGDGATLTNSGTILSDPGPAGQGTRVIDGHNSASTLVNAAGGTITVNQDLQINDGQAGVFTTNGNITIPTGQKLLVDPSGGSSGGNPIVWSTTLDIAGGTIADNGRFDLGISEAGNYAGGAALDVTGGAITGSGGGLLAVDGGPASFANSGSGSYTFAGSSSANSTLLSGTIAINQTVALSANVAHGDALMTIASNVTNNGTLELTDSDATAGANIEDRLLIDRGDTLTNNGTILSDPGVGAQGARVIDGQPGDNTGTLDNAPGGTITVNQDLQIDDGQAGTFTTSGTVTIAQGEKLLDAPNGGFIGGNPPTYSPALDIAGGTITNHGTFAQGLSDAGNRGGGAELDVTGGSITGGLEVVTGGLATFSGQGSGTYTFDGNPGGTYNATKVSGTIGPNQTLDLVGVDGGPRLEVPSTDTLTNNGRIISDPAGGPGIRAIDGNLVNAGTIDDNAGLQIDSQDGVAAQFTTTGAIEVGSGQTLYVNPPGNGSVFTIAGGTITNSGVIYEDITTTGLVTNAGALVVSGGTVTGNPIVAGGVGANFTGSGTGTFTLVGQSTLSGDVGSGCTVVISGSSTGFGSSTVTAANGFTNAGTIKLTDPDPSGSGAASAQLTVTSGTLTNTGTIVSDPGLAGQGSQSISGDVANDGTFEVNQSLQQSSGAFTNAGNLAIAAGQVFTVPGAYAQTSGLTHLAGAGATLTAPGGVALQAGTLSGAGTIHGDLQNGGAVTPSPSPATLTVTGKYTQSSIGFLGVQTTSGGNDVLAVTGTAALDGSLQATTGSGFTPTTGQNFKILTASSVSGQFATTATGGQYAVNYNPGDVTLTAVTPPAAQGTLTISGGSAQAPDSGTAPAAFTVTLSPAQSSPVTVDYTTADGSAVAGQDYTAKSGQLTFGPGETQQTISVDVLGGTVGPDLTFYVDLSNPSGAVLATGRGTGTITHAPLSLNGGVTPNTGGDGGDATVSIQGHGLYGTPTITLTAAGRPDITAFNVSTASDGSSATATFDLTGAPDGARTVVVTEPGGTGSEMLANAFAVVPAIPPDVTAELAGPAAVTPGFPWSGQVIYFNQGNDDAHNAVIEIDGLGVGQSVSFVDDPADTAMTLNHAASDSVLISVPTIPEQSAGTRFIQFGTVGHSGSSYDLSVYPFVGSDDNFTPPGADPIAAVTGRALSVTATTEKDVLHISSSDVSGDINSTIDVTTTPTPVGTPPPPTFTQTTLPDGELQFTASGLIPPPATSPPRPVFAVAVGGRGAVAVIAAPNPGSVWKKIKVAWKTGKKVWDKAQKIKKNVDKVIQSYNHYQQAKQNYDRAIYVTDCLHKLHLITGLQALTLKGFAGGSLSVDTFNQVRSLPGVPEIPLNNSESTALDTFTNVAQSAWQDALFGDGYTFQSGSPGGYLENNNTSFWIGGVPGSPQDSLADLDARKNYVFNILCPPPPRPKPGRKPPTHHKPKYHKPNRFHVGERSSLDPNQMSGPPGAKAANWVPGSPLVPFTYTAEFQNTPSALAPAFRVVVTDQLSASQFNLATLSLGPVRFGTHLVTPPPGLQSWSTRVDLRPAQNEFVVIAGGLDRATALLTWTFTTIDAATGQPITDPFSGFLPPDTSPPQGEGAVTFTVTPVAGLPTGTSIVNAATVVFDANPPLTTDPWVDTIDRTPPTSRILKIKRGTVVIRVRNGRKMHRSVERVLIMRWMGRDHGSGVATYGVYAAVGRGRFQLALAGIRSNRAVIVCTPGRSYRFYIVASDAAGNRQRGQSRISRPITCG